MHRRNKAPRAPGNRGEEPWFENNRKRQRRRSKIAKQSRKRNRGK
jgi:hypothetical protein